MLTYKLLGGGLLLCAAAGGWYALMGAERERLRQGEAFLRLICRIRCEIGDFCRPLPDIYAVYTDPVLERCGFLALLRERGELSSALEAATSLPAFRLKGEELSVLREMAEQLGRGYATEQTRLCDNAVGRLERVLGELRSRLPGKSRLCRSLFLCGAGCLAILLM